MSEAKQRYGPHEFESARPPAPPHEVVLDGPLPELKCKLCGAWRVNFDEPFGGNNRQEDPNVCGRNPIPTEEGASKQEESQGLEKEPRYGPHNFDISRPEGSLTIYHICDCGAFFSHMAGCQSGPEDFNPAENCLPDQYQCRLNPLSPK